MMFQGTWVLVTGASSGIGEEFARQPGSKPMPRRVVAWGLARAMERMGRAGGR